MERRSVDLVALCAEAVNTAAAVGPEWPVTFRAAEPIEVEGDATSLRQVIDNLLGNVRAHTPPGTVARVSVERDTDGDGAVITVADNGPGMEPEEAAHIFERFYRSDPSRSRAHGGAGLGLSIVSAIVANHGGTVSAQGRPGEGTAFTVHLPAVMPSEDQRVRRGQPDQLGLGPAPVGSDTAHVDLGPEPLPPKGDGPTDG
jgi:two-component system OmpR family sensor kinase